MINLRWETVRIFGDSEPVELEAAIRHVLSNEGGTWQVTLARSSTAWKLGFERQEGAGRRLSIRTSLSSPIGSETSVRTILAGVLRG